VVQWVWHGSELEVRIYGKHTIEKDRFGRS